MYNDTIKVDNKIITDNDLVDIFNKMNELIEKYDNIRKQEENQNKIYESEYQKWTAKDFRWTFKFTVNFYDDTNISFDNYNDFMGIFNSRIHEIKYIHVWYSYSYSVKEKGQSLKYYSQNISMYIYESKMDIEINLSSEDKKMDEVYELIKNKILSAPEKYDRIIKNKSFIINKIGLSIGLIPAIIITLLLLFVPIIKELYSMGYIIYPIATILLGFMIGSTICTYKVSSLYESILPDKKYSHYDTNSGRSVYVDDIDSFKSSSEILIGKKTDNLLKRNQIIEMEEKYTKFIPYELLVILLISIIVVIL